MISRRLAGRNLAGRGKGFQSKPLPHVFEPSDKGVAVMSIYNFQSSVLVIEP